MGRYGSVARQASSPRFAARAGACQRIHGPPRAGRGRPRPGRPAAPRAGPAHAVAELAGVEAKSGMGLRFHALEPGPARIDCHVGCRLPQVAGHPERCQRVLVTSDILPTRTTVGAARARSPRSHGRADEERRSLRHRARARDGEPLPATQLPSTSRQPSASGRAPICRGGGLSRAWCHYRDRYRSPVITGDLQQPVHHPCQLGHVCRVDRPIPGRASFMAPFQRCHVLDRCLSPLKHVP